MEASALRQRITKRLLTEIDEVQYPSAAMLNRVESRLTTRDELEDYGEMLAERIEATRFPSVTLMQRLDAVLDRLERAERSAADRG